VRFQALLVLIDVAILKDFWEILMQILRTRLISVLLTSMTVAGISAAQTNGKPDLRKEPTLYAVGYAHLDTEWRWEYPQVIDEYLRRTMEDNFRLFEKYPHYTFNFSGANRYRLMQEYFPDDFAKVKHYVAQGRWFPAGSSMEEGDVNAPSGEAIIRQILYGNEWFRSEFGKASEEYMLPDCFGFPSSLPSILAHAGVKGFSTQKLTWGSSAYAGGPDSLEKTPVGTPFNVGVWVGPDGHTVLAAMNPGSYGGRITTDLSRPLPELPPSPALADVGKRLAGYQRDWASRVITNGNVTGVLTDYHYYGTGDIGGAPDEESVKRLEAIVTKGKVDMPPPDTLDSRGGKHPEWPTVQAGEGPVHVISATADQMFKDLTPAEASALPRYTGELELTNHSAGSLTSQSYQKRWIRKEELLADAAEKSSIAAAWLGARAYPQQRLNNAWTLAMAAHFHDLAAGTATPRAYEFAWNDDVIAMNQFAGVLKSATDGVSAALDTQAKGVPVIVFNPLNIARQDVVETSIDFPGQMPKAVRVTAPDGTAVPAQISNGKVLFEANVPSVGYAVYDIEPADAVEAGGSSLHVTQKELENEFYRVRLNADGDVASVFDKTVNRELLSAPARLALSYDNPAEWPAWNMDWDQEQASPKEYVSGPVKLRIVEDGPVRVGIEVTRETAGSRFMQTIRLSGGDAGKRVEFGNVIDWSTRERNLKATFPLVASNELATYNLDIGTILRPTAEPKKFEVPSHQWIDLTDMSGQFGTTILTDCKNGSDKPNDHTIRLTLIRTPGIAGGYADQATQDFGHHEFIYGLAGHAEGWRESQTDWQAQRLNAPLIAFEAEKHPGSLGKSFSLLKVSNPRVRVLAVKKAEESDEVIVRLVELDGKPQSGVHVAFAKPITAAREVNGQEQAIGTAEVNGGEIVTSFGAYQPRAFAVKLGTAPVVVAGVRSVPVSLNYDLSTASNSGDQVSKGFNGNGDALPAEMLPTEIPFNGVVFHLAKGKTGTPNAVVARGQRIALPQGQYNRVYVLTASINGDQKASFEVGDKKAELDVQDWSGFVGQWDDRRWSSTGTSHDNYGEMVGLKPGFIKRADLVWYSDHHHNAEGKNIPYSYSYLFGYGIDLPPGARTLRLPKNENIRILAISIAEETPETKPAQPLYDVLPSLNAGTSDFVISAPTKASVSQGGTSTSHVLVMPRGSFDGKVRLAASGLSEGMTASFNPDSASGVNVMTLTASKSATAGTSTVTITAMSGDIKRRATMEVSVTRVLTGTVPVDLAPAYNVTGIYKKGSKFEQGASLDGDGYAFAEDTLGRELIGDEVVFKLGPTNVPNAITSERVNLPAGQFASLRVLATAVEGNQRRQTFTVKYTDGTSSSFTQGLSDWAGSTAIQGESLAVQTPYRLAGDGSVDGNPFSLWAYRFPLDPSKEVRSVSLPSNRNVAVFAVTLVPAGQ
jgi:alpha-mannosidase